MAISPLELSSSNVSLSTHSQFNTELSFQNHPLRREQAYAHFEERDRNAAVAVNSLHDGLNGLQEYLNIDLSLAPYDNNALQRLMVEAAALRSHSFPDFLHHEGQVATVAASIGRQIDPDVEQEAATYGITHDMGRRIALGDDHAVVGAELMNRVKMPQNLVDFGYVHHRGGLGPNDCPTITYLGHTPHEVITHKFQQFSHDERAFIADHILNGQIIDDDFNGMSAAVATHIDLSFGPSGLAALVADWSKNSSSGRTDPHANPHIPFIAPFDRSVAQSLFERQIEKYHKHGGQHGGYERGSDQHLLDVTAALAVEQMIDLLGKKYGVDYKQAVTDAQEQWPAEIEAIQQMWNEVPPDRLGLLNTPDLSPKKFNPTVSA